MFLRFFSVLYNIHKPILCQNTVVTASLKKIAYCMDQPVRSLQLFFFAKIWVF